MTLGVTRLVLAALVLASCADAPAPATPADPPPARRIVTLAPHLTELAYSAGAGGQLVGVAEFSDYPDAARALPRIGDAFRVDYEALTALAPDLVLAWGSGNPPENVERLRSLGFRVVTFEPASLDDVAEHIAAIGRLAGSAGAAEAAAAAFRQRLAALRASRPPGSGPRVFVQLAARPYFTVTDRHFLGQGLALCGGVNVFGGLAGLTAIVSEESVIEASPEVIVASDMGGGAASLEAWRAWKDLPAARDGRLYTLDADLLSRPSERILDGVEGLCALLAAGRPPLSKGP